MTILVYLQSLMYVYIKYKINCINEVENHISIFYLLLSMCLYLELFDSILSGIVFWNKYMKKHNINLWNCSSFFYIEITYLLFLESNFFS